MIASVRKQYEKLLEAIVILLMAVLAIEVTVGVIFRSMGHSLVWYDEVASILLEPIPITQENLDVVLDAGWIDEAALCQGVEAGSVPACG